MGDRCRAGRGHPELARPSNSPPTSSDIDQVWVAARALLDGRNPFQAVIDAGRGSPVGYSLYYALYYPLPAVLLVVPLARLPLELARAIWAGLGAALFTAAGLRYGRGLLVALLSASFLNTVLQGQWSTYLTAAAILPWLGFVWVGKPSVSAALFLGFPSRQAIIGGVILVVLSLLVRPTWPGEWLGAIRSAALLPPVARPGGVLLLLALLRWRLPEGRLLAALACVPHTLGLYESLPLFLIPRSRWQGYLLAILSYAAAFCAVLLYPQPEGQPVEAVLAYRWPVMFACLYVPALLMVLLRRDPSSGNEELAIVDRVKNILLAPKTERKSSMPSRRP